MNRCDSGYCCTKVENLSVTKGKEHILKDINMHIHCGQLISIIGKNGAGKTTFFKALLGEIKYSGNISFHNHKGAEKKLTIGYVPQKLNLDENSPTSVYDMVASMISNAPVFLHKSKKVYDKIAKQFSDFNARHLIDKRICDLSGGELQRVMLSLAMMPTPDILLLDEPASGVDSDGLQLFYNKLEELKTRNDIAIVVISHDFQYIEKYSDKVILLDKTILKEGSPCEVLNSKEFKGVFRC